MSLEFKVLIDAVKLPAALARPPPQTSTSATFKYQVTWSAGTGKHSSEEGATLALANTEGEVLFHHDASFRTPKSPDRLLQLTVLQVRNRGGHATSPASTPRAPSSSASSDERSVLGVLVIDLNAHVPKAGAVTSKQRATLALSLCPYDPPAMIRLAVESTKSHLPYDPELEDRKLLDSRRRSASRQRSVPQQETNSSEAAASGRHRGGLFVPSLPITPSTFEVSPGTRGGSTFGGHETIAGIQGEELLDDDKMEIARLKAAVHTLTSANSHLRDDNKLLRNAVQRARDEPSYSYQFQRPNNASKSDVVMQQGGGDTCLDDAVSPEPRVPSAMLISNQNHNQNDNVQILQAEIAVLQRGLTAAKERLLQKDLLEQDLRAEIRSLTMTNNFQAEDIQRLEEELRRHTAKERQIADEEAELQQQKRSIAELQAKSRLLAVELQNEEHLRSKLDEEHKSLRKEYDHIVKRRQQAEEEDAIRREAHHALVVQLEHRLGRAQSELETLHKYAAEANERCHSIAHIVESQSKIIDTKNGKIRGLKSLLEAQDIYKKMLERHQAPSSTGSKPAGGGRQSSPAPSQRPSTPRTGTRH